MIKKDIPTETCIEPCRFTEDKIQFQILWLSFNGKNEIKQKMSLFQ